ncbi:hypothetical protein [Pararcticibacter amylolyticus]|nr:hypothetical protein [Pararcticibacter amylolyticus]
MVIVIALVIAIFSSSLIATAYYYRLEYQKNIRLGKLETNLHSGISMVLSASYPANQNGLEQRVDLFGEQNDSLLLRKEKWGIFEVGTVRSFVLADTLKKAFFVAEECTKDQTALYLSDEDRPLSVSGSTQITGDAELPKAGIKEAYVDGKPYAGKKLVDGKITDSSRELPKLNQSVLDDLEKYFADSLAEQEEIRDTLINSFFSEARIIRIPKSQPLISNRFIKGKIVLLCDTVLTIGENTELRDVMVFAPAIVVKEGFKGSCQLYARDSVVAAAKTVFEYPSAIGVLRKSDNGQPRIELGSECRFSGVLFSWERKRSELQTIISLGKDALVKGEVFATGFVKMAKPLTIDGRVACNRFIIQTPSTLYENYLIDITINRKRRSKYYLSSFLFDRKSPKQILQWLN